MNKEINLGLQYSQESCDENNNFTMCPLCNKFCGYWSLDQICYTVRATHLFDNGATVFFAIFMSLWGRFMWFIFALFFLINDVYFELMFFLECSVLLHICLILLLSSATTYLEFWKREQASIQFLWDLRNFEEEEVCWFVFDTSYIYINTEVCVCIWPYI